MRLVRHIAPRLVVRSWGLPPAATNLTAPLINIVPILHILILVVWLRGCTCVPGLILQPCPGRAIPLLLLPLRYLIFLWILLFRVVVFVIVPSPMGAGLPAIRPRLLRTVKILRIWPSFRDIMT